MASARSSTIDRAAPATADRARRSAAAPADSRDLQTGKSAIAALSQKHFAGLRTQQKLLHDGRTASVTQAIRLHDGQGLAARTAFEALSSADGANLLAFLGSL